MSCEKLTIVAFGDSITNGVTAFEVTDATAYRGRVEQQLRAELAREVTIVNAGVNGDITPLALERIETDVLEHRPQIVTVMFGVNDAGFYRPATDSFADTPRVALPDFTQCLRTIVQRIGQSGARVILLTPLPMNRHYWGTELPAYVQNGLNYLVCQYAQACRDVAAGASAPLVDTYAYFDSHPETVDLVPDGIHPNPEGHRVIADLLYPILREVAARA